MIPATLTMKCKENLIVINRLSWLINSYTLTPMFAIAN